MRTIALISQKGGAGKTTLAIALAVTAERAGLASVLVDLDPQASAAQWSDLRQAKTPVVTCTPAASPHIRLDSRAGCRRRYRHPRHRPARRLASARRRQGQRFCSHSMPSRDR